MTAHGSPTGLRNLEGHHEFDITWPWVGRRPAARAPPPCCG